MFETYVIEKKMRMPKWAKALIIASVVLHAGAGAGLAIYSWFKIDKLDLVEGTYRIDLAAHKADGYPYDYHRLLYSFRVKSKIRDVGIYRPEHRWEFSGDIALRPVLGGPPADGAMR